MLARGKTSFSKSLMNRFRLLHIGFGGISRDDMGDEMRKVFITRFAEMNLVSVPTQVALVSIMGFRIIG